MTAFKLLIASLAMAAGETVTFEFCEGPLGGIGFNAPLDTCIPVPLGDDPTQTYSVKITGDEKSQQVTAYTGSASCEETATHQTIPVVCDTCNAVQGWGVKSDCVPPPFPPATSNSTEVVTVETCGSAPDAEMDFTLGNCVVPDGDYPYSAQMFGSVDQPILYLFSDKTCTTPWVFVKLSCDCIQIPQYGGIQLGGCSSSSLAIGLLVGIIVGAFVLVVVLVCCFWYFCCKCTKKGYDTIVNNA